MAVLFYAEGEHPAGFVGYRVATTIGENSEFRQRYFPLSQYSPATALALAETMNNKWRDEAALAKRGFLLIKRNGNAGAGHIIQGLSASLKVERGRKENYGTYITPCFVVGIPGYGNGEKRFCTTRLGLDGAFEAAVEYYSMLHFLTDDERSKVAMLKPSKRLFSEVLRLQLLRRGIFVSESYVTEKLSVSTVC